MPFENHSSQCERWSRNQTPTQAHKDWLELRDNTPPPSSNLDFIKASQDIVSDSCLSKIIAHNVSVGAEIRLLLNPAQGMELRYSTPPSSSNLDFIKASQDMIHAF